MQNMLRRRADEYRVARRARRPFSPTSNRLRAEGQELNMKESSFSPSSAESDSNQQLYEAVLKRFKETGVAGGLETNNVRVVEGAVAPTRPSSLEGLEPGHEHRRGLLLGLVVAFTVDYFDRP